MKETLPCLSAIAVIACLWSASVQGAESPATPSSGSSEVDRVLNRYIEALGGKAALEKVTSRVMKGAVEVTGMAMSASWEAISKAPDKTVSTTEIEGMGTVREGYDGKVAWSQNPWTGNRDKDGQELAKVKRDSTFRRDLALKTLYPTLAVKGAEKDGGREYKVLEAKMAEGAVERFYFDAKDGLLAKQESDFVASVGKVHLVTQLEDYRVVEGVRYPHTMRVNFNAEGQQPMEVTIKIKALQVNVPIDDAKFAKPSA